MGLVEHPPSPLGAQPGAGSISIDSARQRIQRPVRRPLGNVWRTVNPLFIGSSSVAAVALWRSGLTAGQVGAVVSAALGALVFANAYFVNNGVVWQILDPVRMLTALAWATSASEPNAATTESG